MKRLILIAAGAFALVAGSAHAGGLPNCACENGAKVADSELERIADETDPGLLALLKKEDDATEIEKISDSPIVQN